MLLLLLNKFSLLKEGMRRQGNRTPLFFPTRWRLWVVVTVMKLTSLTTTTTIYFYFFIFYFFIFIFYFYFLFLFFIFINFF